MNAQWHCPPQVIVVGVDFGHASTRALALAGFMASAFHASLRALHAERFEPPPYFTVEQIERLEAERRMTQARTADHLMAFAAEASACKVEPVIVDEPPVEAILDAASGADLIVVGTHGRRGPGRWWLGSVAERVVRAAPIPVLVTRAAATPPQEIFERMAIVRDTDHESATARAYAQHLAALAGGVVTDGGVAAHCDAGVLQRASLVVFATRHDRPSWGIADPVVKVLGGCQRPILFIPDV
jgi:nucleotide-binding universal stress UspA family protein